jgi:fumarate hydratase subunit alpha
MSRIIRTEEIAKAVSRLCRDANLKLSDDVYSALQNALSMEESSFGKEVLTELIENAETAAELEIPICQDTGFTIVFIDMGQDVHIEGGGLKDAVDAGVREAYRSSHFRTSVADDHIFSRKNTGDNTPSILHLEMVPGDVFKVTVMIKGGGSESVGRAGVLKPAEGKEGIRRFVLETVEAAGPNPCPPIIVGVGYGGTTDYAAYLAKRALLKSLDEKNPDPNLAELEQDLLDSINRLGIGPAGMGGRVTAIATKIATHPSHIATMPVAVDISCYALRRKSVQI